jgi:hypothetical protein
VADSLLRSGFWPGFGPRTTAIPVLREKVQLARERGHGVVFFYWEGLWGMHVSPRDRQRRYGLFKEFGEFEQQ